MRAGYFLRRLSSFSFKLSVSNLTRGYYKSLNNRLSMTLPEKCVQIPSKASVELNTTTTTNASWSFLSSIRRATLVLLATGGYILAHHTTISPAKCLMDTTEGDINKESLKPLEMNEVAALTHTSLLRQASAVAVDSALQLLHRTLRASVDFSAQYRKQLNEVIDLMEFCTVTLSNAGQHDSMWELLVAARAHADSLQQQLRDLNIMMGYAYVVLENAAMAAYMNGEEFTATAAQQAISNAKYELEQEAQKNHALEIQYVYAHTHYIEASQQLDEEQEMSNNITTPNDGLPEGETDHQEEASTC